MDRNQKRVFDSCTANVHCAGVVAGWPQDVLRDGRRSTLVHVHEGRYLVNAADPVLTVSIEFGIRETDPARAASIIVEHMKADAKGVRLHKCEPLYWHCCNVFEEVITEPV